MENKEDWTVIAKSSDKFDLELKQAKLKEAGIDALLFDHLDSMYKMLNDTNYGVGLFVHKKDEEKAITIIQNQ